MTAVSILLLKLPINLSMNIIHKYITIHMSISHLLRSHACPRKKD